MKTDTCNCKTTTHCTSCDKSEDTWDWTTHSMEIDLGYEVQEPTQKTNNRPIFRYYVQRANLKKYKGKY